MLVIRRCSGWAPKVLVESCLELARRLVARSAMPEGTFLKNEIPLELRTDAKENRPNNIIEYRMLRAFVRRVANSSSRLFWHSAPIMVVLAFRGVSDVDLVVFVAAFLGDRCDWDGTFDQGLPWLCKYRGN